MIPEPDWAKLLRDADERGKDDAMIRGLAGAVRYLLGCRQELRRTNGELAGMKIGVDWGDDRNYGHGPRTAMPSGLHEHRVGQNVAIGAWTDEELQDLRKRSTAADFNRIQPKRMLDDASRRPWSSSLRDGDDVDEEDFTPEQGKDVLKAVRDHANGRDQRMIDEGYRYDDFLQEWVKR